KPPTIWKRRRLPGTRFASSGPDGGNQKTRQKIQQKICEKAPPQIWRPKMVRPSHAREQCLGFGKRRLRFQRSQADRQVIKAVGRTQPSPQILTLPVGHVY